MLYSAPTVGRRARSFTAPVCVVATHCAIALLAHKARITDQRNFINKTMDSRGVEPLSETIPFDLIQPYRPPASFFRAVLSGLFSARFASTTRLYGLLRVTGNPWLWFAGCLATPSLAAYAAMATGAAGAPKSATTLSPSFDAKFFTLAFDMLSLFYVACSTTGCPSHFLAPSKPLRAQNKEQYSKKPHTLARDFTRG